MSESDVLPLNRRKPEPVPVVFSHIDPGAIGAGNFWIDTVNGTGNWALKVRNHADNGWETIGSADGSVTNDDIVSIAASKITGSFEDVSATGQFLAPAGAIGSPGHSFTSADTTGLYNPATTILGFVSNGVEYMRLDSTGLDITSDRIRLRTAKTPASAAATGAQGDIAWDASFIYICTATNTWKRVAIATW